MVRVMGAQVTEVRTARAASRVNTHTGRRPAGGPRSAQKMSLRATTQEWSEQRVVERTGRDGGRRADARTRSEAGDRPPRVLRRRAPLARHGAAVLIGWCRGRRPMRRVVRRDRRRVERALHVEPSPYGNPYGGRSEQRSAARSAPAHERHVSIGRTCHRTHPIIRAQDSDAPTMTAGASGNSPTRLLVSNGMPGVAANADTSCSQPKSR